jgi:hypothetical protein
MKKGYTFRKDKGYEIQFYDNYGCCNYVIGCNTLEDVANCLISYCNTHTEGHLPTIYLDGKLIRL